MTNTQKATAIYDKFMNDLHLFENANIYNKKTIEKNLHVIHKIKYLANNTIFLRDIDRYLSLLDACYTASKILGMQ